MHLPWSVAPLLLIALSCPSWVGRVRAELPAALPCREAELVDALKARAPELPLSELDLSLFEGRVLIRLGIRARVVDVGDAKGKDAARVLALVIADLASQPEPEPSQGPTAKTAPPSAAGSAANTVQPALAPVVRPTVHAARPGRKPSASPASSIKGDRVRWVIDVAGQRGLSAEEPFSLDAGIGGNALFFERLVLGARAGYMHVPTVRSVSTGTAVHFDALTLRAVVGIRVHPVELSLGPNLVPYWVRGGDGHRDLLPGANLQLALWLPVVGSLRLVARMCFEVFGNRARFFAGGDAVLTTPQVMAGLALGFGWGWT